jgi:hypothetical protein
MYSVRLKPFTLDELHALVFRLDIAETVEPLDEVAERFQPMELRYAATRVAMWFIMESKRMAKQGKTAQEFIERLNDFRHVLKDWRDHPVPPK